MTASRPGSGQPSPGPDRVLIVPPFPCSYLPRQFDETPPPNVRPARRLTFRRGPIAAAMFVSLRAMPGGIHHSVVVVRDLQTSLRFYQDGLGLDLLQDR